MGWDGTVITHYKNGRPDVMAEFYDRYQDIGEEKCVIKPIKAVKVGSVIYSAVKNERTEEVFGMVSLTRKDGNYLMFKEMDETMLPYYYDCPKSVLNLLTPTTNEEALKWREKCIEYQEEKKTHPAYIKNSKVGDRLIYQNEKIIEHKAPNHQFKTDWWYVSESNTYVSKERVNPETAKLYTRENLEKSFLAKILILSSKELTMGMPNFIKNNCVLEFPNFYSNLVLKNDDLDHPLSSFYLRQKDGEIIFTTRSGDCVYHKEDFPEVCAIGLKVFEEKLNEYQKTINKDDVKDIENAIEELLPEEEIER